MLHHQLISPANKHMQSDLSAPGIALGTQGTRVSQVQPLLTAD